jgi:hypothetical protein
MRIRLGCGLLLASLLISTSALSDGKDASYFCTEKLGAGLRFDLQTKQWHVASFNANTAFVLRLHYLGDKQWFSFKKQRYSVTITQQGSNDGQKCSDTDRDAAADEVNVFSLNLLECMSIFGLYEFNLINNRYLQFYPNGYIDGRDDGKDTPSVEAGTCTLIQ